MYGGFVHLSKLVEAAVLNKNLEQAGPQTRDVIHSEAITVGRVDALNKMIL